MNRTNVIILLGLYSISYGLWGCSWSDPHYRTQEFNVCTDKGVTLWIDKPHDLCFIQFDTYAERILVPCEKIKNCTAFLVLR